MNEQISEDFARELLNTGFTAYKDLGTHDDYIIENWKRFGYIKQTREEEIREKLNKRIWDFQQEGELSYEVAKYLSLQRELIEILDNKIKELKQE